MAKKGLITTCDDVDNPHCGSSRMIS